MVSFTNLQADLHKLLSQAVDTKVFPGVVVGVTYSGKRLVVPVGRQTFEKKSKAITKNSIYDVASITKSIPTSLLALYLVEKKRITLDQKISSILPEFRGKWKESVTLFHLLTQTVDFGLRLSLLKDKTPDEIRDTIFTCDLVSKPGTTYSYVNSTSIILGYVIEKVSGAALAEFASEVLFRPLKLTHTSFSPTQFIREDIVPSEIDSWRAREIRGEVHDESAYLLSKISPVGSAGLFSNADDLLTVLEMLLYKGEYGGKKIFSEGMIERMSTNQLEKPLHPSGLGWEMEKEFMGNSHSVQTIAKSGFTGCCVLVDFRNEVGIVILSNHHYPYRSDSKEKYKVRSKICDTILSQIL